MESSASRPKSLNYNKLLPDLGQSQVTEESSQGSLDLPKIRRKSKHQLFKLTNTRRKNDNYDKMSLIYTSNPKLLKTK